MIVDTYTNNLIKVISLQNYGYSEQLKQLKTLKKMNERDENLDDDQRSANDNYITRFITTLELV